jgi:integrase
MVGRCAVMRSVRLLTGLALRRACLGSAFHDLRHTGQTLAAATGATVKDLMRRLGHASPALSDLAAHGDAARLPKSIVVKH